MVEQINPSYQQQDIFFGLNSTVIIFYSPNSPPTGPIKVTFESALGVPNKPQDYGVQETLQSPGFPAIGTNLNISDALSLVDSKFTGSSFVVNDNYAIGIFYPSGLIPNDFLLSKNSTFSSTINGSPYSNTVAANPKS